MDIKESQELIRETFFKHDYKRGLINTWRWFKSEVNELEDAINNMNNKQIEEELADVYAWLLSIANLLNIDLDKVFTSRYGNGCPKCLSIPCKCNFRSLP